MFETLHKKWCLINVLCRENFWNEFWSVLKMMRWKFVSIVRSVKNVISFMRLWMNVKQKVYWALITRLKVGKLCTEEMERINILKYSLEIKQSFVSYFSWQWCCDISTSTSMLQKANILLLTKEATEKDKSLKTQLLLSTTNSQSSEKISGEKIWKKNGFFQMKEQISTLKRKTFLENPLCYVNQAYFFTVKGGELAIYNHNFILG